MNSITDRRGVESTDLDVTNLGSGHGDGLDRVILRGLRARGRHGVLAAERELGQEFIIDVTIFLDTAPAAAADDLTKTVHYGELAERLVDVVAGDPVDLIETLAQRLADVCLSYAPVQRAQVSVHKPSAPIPVPFEDVIVTITRDKATIGTATRDTRGRVAAAVEGSGS